MTTSNYKTDYVDVDDDGNMTVPDGWAVLQVIDIQPGCIKVLLRCEHEAYSVTENPFE